MTIIKRAGSVLVTAAAVGAVFGLGFAPAMASTPTLKATVTGGGSITAVASKTVLSLKVGKETITVTCTSKGKTPASEASGKIPDGTSKGSSPLAVGSTSKLSFNNCTGLLGKVTTKIESTPYKIDVSSATTSKGDTDGIITGIKVAVSMEDCAFTVTGSAPGYYSNSKHELIMTSTLPTKSFTSAQLTISGVAAGSCAGLVKNGDHPSYDGTYTVKPSVVIKSTS
jgi:hypothetical protein